MHLHVEEHARLAPRASSRIDVNAEVSVVLSGAVQNNSLICLGTKNQERVPTAF